MVSAVFHLPPLAAARAPARGGEPPGAAPAAPAESTAVATPAVPTRASSAAAAPTPSGTAPPRRWARIDPRAVALGVLPPLAGMALLVGIWALATAPGGSFPTPAETWAAAVELFRDPFRRNGPNDQGIGWNVLASLRRVGLGFGLAALVGIPLGFLIGRSAFVARMTAPLIGLLKPVSPLAWLPIGLLVLKAADPAAIWTIFICSIWPMVINTAAGVRQVPQDHLNVARVLGLSEWKTITRIVLPSVLPSVLTGVRLSVGTAWLVIVAAEMLTGGVGIGFWLWDEWNNLNVKHILIAIVVIGVVGLALEQLLVALARRFSHGAPA